MFVIFDTVNFYIYELFHTLLSSWHAKDTWNVYMYVFMYVSFKITT